MLAPRTREILLSLEDIEALIELRGTRTLRIISDEVCAFWFDLGNRHLAATVEQFIPLSQNDDDEALAVRPRWHLEPCPSVGRVLFENALVEDVSIVRTLLWFTDHVRFTTEEEALAGMAPPTTQIEEVLHQIIGQSSGGHDECVSNPAKAVGLTVPVANLVDVGFVALVEGRSLACFAPANAYLRQTDFVDQLSHDFAESYQLIPLETALQEAVSLPSRWT